jgi:ribose transport system ATP-binding protein
MALLELRGVSKSFPGVQALRAIDLDVRAGEVHAIVGENGAGKSTLIKLLSGVYMRDAGSIHFNGQEVSFASPHESQRAGIRTLYQEPNVLPQLTVAENIYLGSEPHHRWLPLIDWAAIRQGASQVLKQLDVDIPPEKRVAELSAAERQMIELAKMLHTQARLLIMDEPTASLSAREVETLFRVIRAVKANGIGVIYVSHRLDEVLAIADSVTVLRDSRRIATLRASDTTVDQLVWLMSGHIHQTQPAPFEHPQGVERLRVENLTHRPAFEDISFQLYAGEILGLAGLVGAGRSALVRAIFGLEAAESGTLYVEGEPVSVRSPADALSLGIGLLPEDRQEQAVLLNMTARENISLAALAQSGLLVNAQDEASLAENYIQRLRIKLPTPEVKAGTLSGGTQQKLILSRWLAVRPRILIFDEPTRGIDINAKAEIYRLMHELAAEGIAILMVSSELAEIAQACSRALVMRSGHIIAELGRDMLTEENLARCVMGDGLP